MALILNIETATTNCSVSLSKDGETLILKENNSKNYSHAEQLHLFIDDLFKGSGFAPSDLDAVAVSKGPGSYTGLRIGVSTAKGLSYALNTPLLAVDTLEILARKANISEGVVIPMLDARRMEVYSAIYDSELKSHRKVAAEIVHSKSYKELLTTQKVCFIGSGVNKVKDIISHQNAVFMEDKLPSANEMAVLSESKYKKGDTEDVAYFEPYYLKDFIALKKKV